MAPLPPRPKLVPLTLQRDDAITHETSITKLHFFSDHPVNAPVADT